MTASIRSIMHPTDFSEPSMNAFVHALRVCVATKAKLYVLHVADGGDADPWHSFPHVRQTLSQWGLFDASQSPAELLPKLGIEVVKVEVEPQDPVEGLARFLAWHETDLMVIASHSRDGLPRWLRPSIAEAMSRRSAAQSLFISAQCRGFVDQGRGAVRLKHVLVPIDHHPPAAAALSAIRQFCRMVTGEDAQLRVIHVGETPPDLTAEGDTKSAVAVELRAGNVVDAILAAAADFDVDLIGMATEGHQGVLDAIRGSTTERVVRHAPCPVLAIPAIRGRLQG